VFIITVLQNMQVHLESFILWTLSVVHGCK